MAVDRSGVTSSRRRLRPSVSVGLPVWNGEQYVGAAIESILAQTHGDLELVICDNASTDGTETVCRAYARADSRIRYVRNSVNLGAAPNFNRCFELAAATTYFKWHSHDDLVSPSYIANCIEALERDPTAVLVFGRTVYVDEEDVEMAAQAESDLSVTGGTPSRRVRELVGHALGGPDVYWSIYGVARRRAVEETHLHGGYIASDQVFLLELALQGRLLQIDGPWLSSRRHPAAWTSAERDPVRDIAWFDASQSSQLVFPHWTLFARHYGAIWKSEIAFFQQLSASISFSRRVLREWRTLGGDVKQAVRYR